jgi:hypothetical protein
VAFAVPANHHRWETAEFKVDLHPQMIPQLKGMV